MSHVTAEKSEAASQSAENCHHVTRLQLKREKTPPVFPPAYLLVN